MLKEYSPAQQLMRQAWAAAATGSPSRPTMVFDKGLCRLIIGKAAREHRAIYSKLSGVPSTASQREDEEGNLVLEWESYVDDFFGSSGGMANMIPGYQPRSGQTIMARVVQRAIEMGDVGIVAAPCGTGKSLAYLIPAARYASESDRTVVIATSNKALQDQIANHDAPMVAEVFGDLKIAVLKGKSNYVCDSRVAVADMDDGYRYAVDCSDSGELDDIDIPDSVKSEINVEQGTICDGCPFREHCRYLKARREVRKADIIVTNHAMAAIWAVDPGISVFPNPNVIIVDEAHNFASAVRDAAGGRVTLRGLKQLEARVNKYDCAPDSERLWRAIDKHSIADDGGIDADTKWDYQWWVTDMKAIANSMRIDIPETDIERNMVAVGKRIDAMVERVIATFSKTRPGFCRWAELDDNKEVLAVECTPVDVAPIIKNAMGYTGSAMACCVCETHIDEPEFLIRGRLICDDCCMRISEEEEADLSSIHDSDNLQVDRLAGSASWIFTSATLEVAESGGSKSLKHFASEIGIPAINGKHCAIMASVPSPFDYKGTVLYVPNDIPEPVHGKADHSVAAIGEIKQLVERSKGGALIIFTSNSEMDKAWQALHKPFGKMGLQCFKQGDKPKSEIIREFKSGINGVIFGVASFKEGVDIPGLALRLVILNKIPFAPPTPLGRAREEVAKAEAKTIGYVGQRVEWYAFAKIGIAEASIELQQVFGRLNRRVTDKGVVAFLDPRIATKGYGKMLTAALPPVERIDKDLVMPYLGKLAEEAVTEVGQYQQRSLIKDELDEL